MQSVPRQRAEPEQPTGRAWGSPTAVTLRARGVTVRVSVFDQRAGRHEHPNDFATRQLEALVRVGTEKYKWMEVGRSLDSIDSTPIYITSKYKSRHSKRQFRQYIMRIVSGLFQLKFPKYKKHHLGILQHTTENYNLQNKSDWAECPFA